MLEFELPRKRLLLAATVALVALAALGGTALAVDLSGSVKSYTGCLVTKGSTLTLIKEGESPQKPCPSGSTEAHFSGGDITEVNVQEGGGLTGGGTNGAVSLSLRRDCGTGEIVKWNGSAWICGADDNSTYTAGAGLDLNGSEFSVKESYRLPQDGCGSGDAVTRNTAVGGGAATWTCGQFAQANQACASGQFAKGVTAIGTLDC